VVFSNVKFQYLEFCSTNPCDFFTICSTKKSSLPHKKITRLSWISPEILAAQRSIVPFLLPSFGKKVVWPFDYLSFQFSQLMIFIIYSLQFLDVKLISSLDVVFVTILPKYHGYRQFLIFCHTRLKFILPRNGPSKFDRVGVK
jgi:hypothetical protein